MHTLHINLSDSSYPIYIGDSLFAMSDLLASHIRGNQILIVTQANIAQHHLANLKNKLASLQCDEILLPEGEQCKNLTEWQKIFDVLLQKNHDRSTTLIALGGGIVGDMTGFAAACYQRGVNYIQVPTTLIAQVDSAIGGKTGVNHPLAKNMIGAFHQPQCVLIDIYVLKTLPQREFIAGLAEVIKYGVIRDAEFFNWLEKNIAAILAKNTDALLAMITRSVRNKAEIVMADIKDQGERQLLNFGHTFGHALEAASGYEKILHGEAVAIGMLMAAELSMQRTGLSLADLNRIRSLINLCGLLPNSFSIPDSSKILAAMKHDKKIQNGKMRLILLKSIGEAISVANVSEEEVLQSIEKIASSPQR